MRIQSTGCSQSAFSSLLVLLAGLALACGGDSDGGGGGGKQGISITYAGETTDAATGMNAVNTLDIGEGQLATTIVGGWRDGGESGVITTRLRFFGSGGEVSPATFELVADDFLTAERTVAIDLDGAPGLPGTLRSQTGTLTLTRLERSEKKLEKIELNFSGTFAPRNGEAGEDFELTGSIRFER